MNINNAEISWKTGKGQDKITMPQNGLVKTVMLILSTFGIIFTISVLIPFYVVNAQSSNNNFIEYRVRSGDTLGNMAEYFGTDVRSIRNLNGIAGNGDVIIVGDILKIPAQYFDYTVVSGDTLQELSTRFGTTIGKIMLFNRLTNHIIYVGQKLHIPHVSQAPKVIFTTHTVKQGENCWSISINYGIPVRELLEVNKLSESSPLSIGQKLSIPVYSIPVKATPGPQFGEYLDWYTEAQYIFPIGKKAEIIDFNTGKRFSIERTIGASHADCEPLSDKDAEVIRGLWGGNYSWATRSILVFVDGRKIAASMSSNPHGIEYIKNNNFSGHFDIHFKNSRRHKDDAIDNGHQIKVRQSAGV